MNELPDKPSRPRVELDHCGGLWLMTLHGEHDVSTQAMLLEQLEHVREAGGPLVIDLSRAQFLDSTVISAVVVARQESSDDVVLVAPTHYQGTRLVEVIGIGRAVPLYPTRAAAIGAIVE